MKTVVFIIVLSFTRSKFCRIVREESRAGYEHLYREFELALHFNTDRAIEQVSPSPYLPLLVSGIDRCF